MLSGEILKKSTDVLLLNGYTINSVGFAHGKAGIALTLFELAEYLNSERVYDHAVNLLQEVLVCNIDNTDFSTGKAGIAFVLQYVIKQKLLNADYMELYGKCHKDIVDKILSLRYNSDEYDSYFNYFFFSETSDYLSTVDYKKTSETIKNLILRYLSESNKIADIKNIYPIYRLLHVINCIQKRYDDLFFSIERIVEKMKFKDMCSDALLFPLQLYICGRLHRHATITKYTEKMFETSFSNILSANLTLRRQIDAVIGIYRIYCLNSLHDYRNVAYKIKSSSADENIDSFEKKIVELIGNGNSFNFGLEIGFCRLLMCSIYWDKISQGLFPDKFIKSMI